MELNDLLKLIATIAESVKGAKSICDTLPKPIFLGGARKNISKLAENIQTVEGRMTELESKVSNGLPELSKLVRSYSKLVTDVKVAKVLSDKASEICELAPSVAPVLATVSTNDRESEYSEIASGTSRLPNLAPEEKGQLDAKLIVVRDLIRDLKKTKQDDDRNLKRIFDEISTQYSDIQSILSRLLEKILEKLET